MNEKVLKTLEYDKIIEKLSSYASSPMGKELCQKLLPFDSYDDIEKEQQETFDAMTRLYRAGSISFSGVRDIGASLKRLGVGSSLTISELLDIASVLKVTLRVKSYSRGGNETNADESETAAEDSLEAMFRNLEPLSPVANEIERCILSEEQIADDASSGLKNVRRKITLANEQIRSQLSHILNSESRNYLQDALITMRGGRYCVPVRAEHKNQVPGLVHDQSSTGSTIFVEPMSVVKLNNDLRELYIAEQKEIEIVLANLSILCAENLEALSTNLAILVRLDFIFAKAAFGKDLKASRPIFNRNGFLHLKSARHPLLNSHKVVPIDVKLGGAFDQLIITGPNTGGKTVSLKTVGLLSLMGQAGLAIPAFDGSKLSIFREIYADIGDEQSIEQSLSTFSSHMTNIIRILDKADKDSLVLFDELCAGTDPTEGAALAISILTFLKNLRVRTMATTHYSEIKLYALSTDRVENACCEFNVESLSPTYRLLIGIPGKSNAFAISEKLGLPDYIIADAKSNLNHQDISFEDIISDLETSKATITKERESIERYKEEITNLKAKLEQKNERLDAQKERILQQAREEAARVLQEAKDYADDTIKTINKLSQNGNFSMKDLEQERRKLGERVKETNVSKLAPPEPKKKVHTEADFKLGVRVRVHSLNLEGTVLSLPKDGKVLTQMGILKSQLPVSDLEIIDEPAFTGVGAPFRTTGAGKIKMAKTATISTEINLIGKTVDEAIVELDRYMDDAALSHLSSVRIVHGKGTGALRNAVQQYLKKCKHVKSYRLGTFGEGDAGVTIAEMK